MAVDNTSDFSDDLAVPQSTKSPYSVIFFFSIILLIPLSIFGYLKYNASVSNIDMVEEVSSGVFTVFPEVRNVVGKNQEWVLSVIQPTVEGFATQDGKNYLLASYVSNSGVKKDIKIFLSGVEDSVEISHLWVVQDDKQTLMDFESLSALLKIGHPIKIDYLSMAPSLSIRDAAYCSSYEDLCALAEIADRYRAYSISTKLVNSGP